MSLAPSAVAFPFALPLALALSGAASADIVGFREDFTAGPANWRNANGASVLAWSATGGPSGAAYVTSTFNLGTTVVGGFPPTVIRAQAGYGSSGGAYAGNWIAAGVTGVSFWFRHDLAEAVTVTGRFATPANFPGASTVSPAVVAPNAWTLVSFDLREESPDVISLGGGTYAAIFSNVANMQFGFDVPASLAGQNVDGHFDLTGFSIVPAPASILAFAAIPAALGRRRRTDVARRA